MTNNKIVHTNPISGDRHPQSENHVKIAGIICFTIVLCLILTFGFFLAQNGDMRILIWIENAQIFLAGFFSAIGMIGAKAVWIMFKNG